MSRPAASFPPEPSQKEVEAFCLVARRGNNAEVTAYLDKYGATAVDRRTVHERTALILAVWDGRRDTVTLLLERGADIHARDKDGMTPLIWAAQQGQKETVALLLEKGANPYERDKSSRTALKAAQERRHAETAALIEQWFETQKQRLAQERQQQQEAERAAEVLNAARLEKLKTLRPPKPALKKNPLFRPKE